MIGTFFEIVDHLRETPFREGEFFLPWTVCQVCQNPNGNRDQNGAGGP